MAIALFDAQAGFGGGVRGQTGDFGADALLAEMDRLDIARALVRIAPDDLVNDVPAANAELYAACADQPRLVPCPILVPNGGYDMPSEEEQVAEAVEHGAGAAFLRPQADYWIPEEWVCGRLLRALEERRLPAYCLAGRFTFEQTAALAGRHPELPVLLVGLPYRAHRTLVPLLETFPNVRISIGSNYTVHDGVELLVAKAGADRLLFGTGLPDTEAAGAVAALMYAELDEAALRRIGSENMTRLLEEIRR